MLLKQFLDIRTLIDKKVSTVEKKYCIQPNFGKNSIMCFPKSSKVEKKERKIFKLQERIHICGIAYYKKP